MRTENSVSEEVSGAADPFASVPYNEFGVNAAFVEAMREVYAANPSALDHHWRSFFEGADWGPVQPRTGEGAAAAREWRLGTEFAEKHASVWRLIRVYRVRGHRLAKTDPLGLAAPDFLPELDPASYGFSEADMERVFIAGDLPGGAEQTLRQILERLRATYCEQVSVEYMHIQDQDRRSWIQEHVETSRNRSSFSPEERCEILEHLSRAEDFEGFLHTKFVGQKRFSLEGGESLIPLLDELVDLGPEHDVIEYVIGMAHRGRLNVLYNVLDKPLEAIFSEFEDNELRDSPMGSGDVKYHKGYSVDRMTRSGKTIHLSLTANPSHLEAVDPVVEGRARAKQTRVNDPEGRRIIPLLLHGDAAFAGQGIVMETINLSHLPGYSTGGTIHIIVNNQIGFTEPSGESRSAIYSTDAAKIIQTPIFHVNGDDPEAVIHVARLAFEYRQRFNDDVVIDLVCYRRHGHNEGDEPSFTNPVMYRKIRSLPSTRSLHAEKLLEAGILSPQALADLDGRLRTEFETALASIHVRSPRYEEPLDPIRLWEGFSRPMSKRISDRITGVTRAELAKVADGIGTVPKEFHLHKKLKPFVERRAQVVAADLPIDWATAEALAFGTLVVEGKAVRLSGQDSGRGTFSQRHAVLVDQETAAEYVPLQHLDPEQARFNVYDSLLSEAAVLGFEYGYSLADPNTLTLWEAQFGDFANGAQVIIDQFIVTAESKWQRMSGLVLLLPHGYEGQGPEHSSARIERFLQLCAEDNIQVVNCTTPAQYFHVLRRQMCRNYRTPLVILAPKSLLRSKHAVSKVEEFTYGKFFHHVLDDPKASNAPERVRRLVFCSGKFYYDLLQRRDTLGELTERIAFLRLEQIYPWPEDEVRDALSRYEHASSVVWAQEEPENMGAWSFVRERIGPLLPAPRRIRFIGRKRSASSAVGSHRIHRQQQAQILDQCFVNLDELS